MSGASRGGLYQDAPAFLARFEGAQRLVRWRREGFTRPKAELGPVSWAYDLTSFHFGLSQRFAVVCATVFYRINLGAAAYDNDGDAVDLGREGYRLVNGLNSADVDPL